MPKFSVEGESYNISYSTLVETALRHGTWYYTGSTCDATSLSQNRHTLDGRLNALTFCWYCIISLEEPVTQGFTLANLGFENFYEQSGDILYRIGASHTYKQVKVIFKGSQIATIFPVLERLTTNMNPQETLEFLDTSKIPVHCMDQLMTAQWFLQETQDAGNYLEHLLDPETRMNVSCLTVKQVMFFAKMNSHLFNYAH